MSVPLPRICMSWNKHKSAISAGVSAMLLHSLCCFAPLVLVLAGLSGAASALTWIEPAEPYLIAFSALTLSFGFYQEYKPKKHKHDVSCECGEEHQHSSISAPRIILWISLVFGVTMFFIHHFTGLLGHTH